jgi:phytoene dehydrogenase-like protein
MSRSYDALVIGAGHNGLSAACLLARAGRKVAVLERTPVTGGLAACHEFHPGYRSAGVLHDTTRVRAAVAAKLQLERHGLRLRSAPPAVLALGAPREGLLLSGDVAGTAHEIAARSPRDAKQYTRYRGFIERLRSALAVFFDEPPVDLLDGDTPGGWLLAKRALRLRRLGRSELLELLRLPNMCIADWLDEWFEDGLLKAALALPAVAGNFTGPRSPGTTANLLLHACAAGPGVEGGARALVGALESAVRAAGVEIRTGARVARIRVAGEVRGVALEDGEELDAPVVAASCHPREVFLSLLPPAQVPTRLARRLDRYRSRGTTAQLLLALRAPLAFAARPDGTPETVRIARDPWEIERAFDAIKYRKLGERPALEVHVPSLASPELAPPGHAVVSVLVHFAPYDLEPAWNAAARERLADRVQAILEEHCRGLDVVARHMLAPPDLEARYALPGGNIHHGEMSLDQMLARPVPECARYATPVPGLYLCGSGSHPGGGLSCMPGVLAAEAILAS